MLARHGLAHGGYLLSVGTLEPRKNLVAAIRAWASLPTAVTAGRPLVVAGAKGWLNDAIMALVERLERAGSVRFLGFVAQEDLPALYSGAIALAYPSRYEGFGLPVVEAMACGVPVITSNASCLPEVAGGAAELVDPDDEAGLAQAMHRLIEDEGHRRALSAAGIEWVRELTWAACAERTLEVYRAVTRGSTHPV